MAGSQLVLEVERDVKAPGEQVPHGVGGDGGIAPVVGPVGPGGGDGPLEFARRVFPGLRFQLREEPRNAVRVLRLPRPRLDPVSQVTPAALFVGGEGGAPYALRGGKLGAVPVGDVANALGGQGVAGVSASSPALDQAPGVHEASHHLADSPLGDAEPKGQVLPWDHRVIGDEVQRAFLRRADAEGRRSLRHAFRVGNRGPLPFRRLGTRPSAGAGAGDHALQREEAAADHPRCAAPEANVSSFQRVPGLHSDVAVGDVPLLAEPRRQPLLPYAGHQDKDGAGTSAVVVLGYGPQPVVERPAPQGQAALWRTTPKLRPSCRVMVVSKRPLRWNSTWDRSPSMPGDIEAASR